MSSVHESIGSIFGSAAPGTRSFASPMAALPVSSEDDGFRHHQDGHQAGRVRSA